MIITETKTFEEVLDETGSLLYKNVGISMLPLIREGRDFIYIKNRPKERLKKYDVALFRRPNVKGRGEYVLHRVLKVNPNGTYWIVGDNCIGGETVREENILGVLSAVRRKGKTVSVTDFGYRLYVYLWCATYPLRFFVLKYYRLPRRIAGKILRKLHLRK